MFSSHIMSDPLKSLHEWLNSNDALPVLKSVAKAVIGWAKSDNRIYDILCIEKDDPTPELGVIAFVLEFLFDEKRLKSCRTQLAEYIENGNLNGVRSILVSRILNHCRDERRKEENSPFHYYYRKMSSTLSADKETQYVYRNETGAYYAASSAKQLGFVEEGRLGANAFKGWPEPGFPLEHLKKTSTQISISRVFWKHAIAELAEEHFLPVIELVHYMDATYNFTPLIQSENIFSNADGEALPLNTEKLHPCQSHDTLNSLASQDASAEQSLLNTALDKAAIRLAESWKPAVRECFYRHLVLELTLQETADRTQGINSSESARNQVNKAKSALLEFFRQWNIAGYDGEKPTDEEKKVVLKAIVDFILKNHPECRDEE